jgi:hypothetical protein
MSSMPNRREFVASTSTLLGGGWLWLKLPALAALTGCARDAARRADPFTQLTPAGGRAVQALAARIIPSGDGVPGADEAGAAWFIDMVIGGPMQDGKALLTEGLADLDVRAEAAGGASFADLPPERQDDVLRDIEDTEFFGFARFLTVMGTFSGTEHGGNRNHAGFALLQIDHRPAYQPPFGWYDEQVGMEGGAT